MELHAAVTAPDHPLSRERAVAQLEALARQMCEALAAGQPDATDLILSPSARAGDMEEDAEATTVCAGTSAGLRRTTQLWAIIGLLHALAAQQKKLTQRELWYRVKPSGLFKSPEEVSKRVLDVCALLSQRSGGRCPREALGIIASPRGFMTGSVALLQAGGEEPLSLEQLVYPVPGDPEECAALRFASNRARCVLVVEKESVFRRLVEDGWLRRLPSVLLTACGFPDYATRAALRRTLDALRLPAFALTDWNPHGLALMLVYKHGSVHAGLDGYACPGLRWIGLLASDALEPLPAKLFGATVPREDLQPFSPRDRSVLGALRQRPSVRGDPALAAEVEAMERAQAKVEIEALSGFGDDFLVDFLVDRVLHMLLEAGE